ncbi:Transcription-repair-coupling factor [Trichinella pseudospiralis]
MPSKCKRGEKVVRCYTASSSQALGQIKHHSSTLIFLWEPIIPKCSSGRRHFVVDAALSSALVRKSSNLINHTISLNRFRDIVSVKTGL